MGVYMGGELVDQIWTANYFVSQYGRIMIGKFLIWAGFLRRECVQYKKPARLYCIL